MHQIWKKDIMYLKKVGPKRAELLRQECRIATYGDLLEYFPRKYVDRSQVMKIGDVTPGADLQTTFVGKITRFDLQQSRRGRSILSATFTDGSGNLELTWFQGIRWVQNTIKPGEELAIFGRPNWYQGKLQLVHPEIDHLAQEGAKQTQQIVPYYPSTDKLSRVGLDARGFRQLIHLLLEETRPYLEETLSPEVLQQYQLIPRPEALLQAHFPDSFEGLERAIYRLKFEELFYFQLMLARRRKVAKNENKAQPFAVVGECFNTFYQKHLPFELTGAQKRVIKEVRRDLGQAIQMNRLVQGDVGSGKTMVAFMSMLIARDNGFQSALMAPTAILAEQHYRKLSELAGKMGLQIALLVGGQRKKERREILARVASGEAHIVIGTHALIEDSVQFQRLGLVVIDEQHKFGVMQRAKLWNKANPYPHNMIMTATPIPRTLAMTVYGDVDVSVIDELPPGRQPIQTMVHGESKRLEVFGFIKRELQKGRQAYVVYPLVEESEKLDLIAAEKGHELLERHFSAFRVGLVHGRMKPDDKEMEMMRFVQRQTQILVSTTVIEVGVDVPNSTIMVIENAERFGLSQLHQLRGRVGRGGGQSYCILMKGKKLSADGAKRLKAMRETTDGFKIAEIDLELRGPGDFLGTRQSGLPQFQLANVVEDQPILKQARKAAFEVVHQDPRLMLPQHEVMRQSYRRYVRFQAYLATVA
jgi:ATP-dependent DNA helicase RecG